MKNLIPQSAICAQSLLEEFDAVAVDAEQIDPESIYVTGQAFNFWVRINKKSQYLVFSTYAQMQVDGASIDALRFVNELNDIWSLAQFSTSFENDRLYAFYMLSFKGGMLRKQFLRTAVHFPNIFSEVVAEGRMLGLIPFSSETVKCLQVVDN